jgi:predicted alpha/beta-hydrolase family hydrolase
VKEFPVFVPFGDERLAAILAIPDGEPAGLVLLMTGIGAPRSHRFSIWTRAARELAGRGVASIRFDYLGIGDSSGIVRQWRMAQPPSDQAEAVARFAMRATGADRFVAVGNCLGSRVALQVAGSMPECSGAMCIRAPILEPGRSGTLRRRVSQWKLFKPVRSNAMVRALTRPLFGRGRRRVLGVGLGETFVRAARHGPVMFLYTEADHTYTDAVAGQLEQWAAKLSSEERARYELRLLPHGPLKGFESTRIQEVVIEAAVDWVSECFGLHVPGVVSRGAATSVRMSEPRTGLPS